MGFELFLNHRPPNYSVNAGYCSLLLILFSSFPTLVHTLRNFSADRDDFMAGETDVFIVPGMKPAGRVNCITLLCWGDDSWEFDWIVVFSVKSYTQPPRVFWNDETVLSTDSREGVHEYRVCRNENVAYIGPEVV